MENLPVGTCYGALLHGYPGFSLAAAIRRIGSASAALIGSLAPVLTIGFGWLLLGEAISIMQLGGVVLVVGGVLKVQKSVNVATPDGFEVAIFLILLLLIFKRGCHLADNVSQR